MQVELFDVKAYLDDRGIRTYTSGKNCSPGWVNIRCLFCQDKTNHLGINLKSKRWHCWKCHRKGLITKVISTIEHRDFNLEELIDEFRSEFIGTHLPKRRDPTGLPKESLHILPTIHKDYLRRRGFDPVEIQDMYHVKACWEGGDYKFRLIIPIYMNFRLAGFTARDVSHKSPIRYRNQPKHECPVLPERWVYNIDRVEETVVVVEGAFDVWRMGNGFVSFMGTEVTTAQTAALVNKGVRRAIVLYDPEEEAQATAEQIAYDLGMFITDVEQVELDLPEGQDPADLSPQDAAYLRSQLL
jgi:DNA primase